MCYTIIRKRKENTKEKENKTMTKEEIIKRMEEIERDRFFLAMADHWTRADFDRDDKLFKEWLKLKNQLKEME